MKIKFTFLTVFLALFLGGTSFAQSNSNLEAAHTLFKLGKYVEAKAIYERNIRVPGARAFIHQCNEAIRRGAGKTQTKSKLAAVRIPKIQLEEVPIRDAMIFLSKRITEISGGKVLTNIIYAGSKEHAENTLITLSLNHAPADVVLEYICQTGNCKPRYDKFAVVVTPISELPQEAGSSPKGSAPAPTANGSTPKAPSSNSGSSPKSTGSGSKTDIF